MFWVAFGDIFSSPSWKESRQEVNISFTKLDMLPNLLILNNNNKNSLNEVNIICFLFTESGQHDDSVTQPSYHQRDQIGHILKVQIFLWKQPNYLVTFGAILKNIF